MTGEPSLHRQVETRLRAHDIRYTRGRRRVVKALATADGPRTAAELHAQLAHDIPVSSLYRSLATFEEVGVVSPHYSTKGIARYELAEWITGHHHHFLCVECGAVDDIELPETLERALAEFVEAVGADVDFTALRHALDIEGLCAVCAPHVAGRRN